MPRIAKTVSYSGIFPHRDHRNKKGRKSMWEKNSIMARKDKLDIITNRELKKELHTHHSIKSKLSEKIL